jgi:succinate dehydrogenase hydrophobic anchor subunit
MEILLRQKSTDVSGEHHSIILRVTPVLYAVYFLFIVFAWLTEKEGSKFIRNVGASFYIIAQRNIPEPQTPHSSIRY